MESEQVVVVTTPPDELPVARRLTPHHAVTAHRPPRRLWWLLIVVAGSLAPVFVIPLRPAPTAEYAPALASLAARPDRPDPATGRLLGHFPYALAAAEDLVEVAPGIRLHVDMAADLQAMEAAAARDGVKLQLLSGFRDHATQQHLFFNVKADRQQLAEERALVSAPPGHSEHHSGYAVDLGDAGQPDLDFETAFENSPAFRWLQQHASSYHFRLSFPEGNRQGVSYEPWHWRWEGNTAALRVFDQVQRFNGNRAQPLITSSHIQMSSR